MSFLSSPEYDACVEHINLGIKFEKLKNTDEAILYYEEAIAFRIVATHPYDRLIVIYNKRKDYRNTLRVVKLAIDVFTNENIRRSTNLINDYPDLKSKIEFHLETNESFKDEKGKWIFVQYDVMKYYDKLTNLKNKI